MDKDNKPTFYWYDFETFGLNKRTDRPAQFAGIRTDMAFNPVGRGDLLYARPAADYLPNPASCLITGITPQVCEEKGVAESEFAGAVWDRFNQPGTVSIGYNTLGFDDEVSRFLFWRNFLDPYAHQWKNGCSRWDIYPLTCAVWSLRGSGLVWPLWKDISPKAEEEGRRGVCFKLEHLSRANGIVHRHAHDAFSDVEATLGLAKLIAEKEPRLWKWAFENRSKAKVKAALESGGPVLWVSPRFGQARGFAAIAAMISPNPVKPNEVFMWDLSRDPDEIVRMTSEELKSRLFVRRDALPEGTAPLPVYRLAINSSPFICANLRVLPADRAARYGISPEQCLANFEKLQRSLPLIQSALSVWAEGQERPKPSDPDFGLYDGGFASDADRSTMAAVRRSSPETLAELAGSGRLTFDDERFTELLFRYRARNWPETLGAEETARWRRFCSERLIEGRDGLPTVSDFFDEIDRLQDAVWENEEQQAVLEALYEWGERLGEACSDY